MPNKRIAVHPPRLKKVEEIPCMPNLELLRHFGDGRLQHPPWFYPYCPIGRSPMTYQQIFTLAVSVVHISNFVLLD